MIFIYRLFYDKEPHELAKALHKHSEGIRWVTRPIADSKHKVLVFETKGSALRMINCAFEEGLTIKALEYEYPKYIEHSCNYKNGKLILEETKENMTPGQDLAVMLMTTETALNHINKLYTFSNIEFERIDQDTKQAFLEGLDKAHESLNSMRERIYNIIENAAG